jgi:hypothetical protein
MTRQTVQAEWTGGMEQQQQSNDSLYACAAAAAPANLLFLIL